MVEFANHGGKCCGAKHIYGLGTNPEILRDAISGGSILLGRNAPKESTELRLKRLLLGVIRFYPSVLVEVILRRGHHSKIDTLKANHDSVTDEMILEACSYSQLRWVPILKGCGFKVKETWHNSNSGNDLVRLSFCTGDRRRSAIIKKLEKELKIVKKAPASVAFR